MPDEKLLSNPIEIPWQLASTTQVLSSKKLPTEATTISLFTYVPKLESLSENYPNDRLVYFKISVSISPDLEFDWPFLAFTSSNPIYHVILDLKITPRPEAEGGIRPYFLSAAPLRRTMLETGIVGVQAFEGESNGLAIGKSGSELHESFRTSTDVSTSSVGGGFSLGGYLNIGASKSGSTTTTTANRDVVQVLDTTTREASQERKELLSHTTDVKNVLTLLTAKYIGTPYLRFNLFPQPLRSTIADPSDRYSWYADLLKRRSSGIEGIQDFYAIAAVPRTLEGFCIHADLTRFAVILPLLSPTPPSGLPSGRQLDIKDFARMTDYLYRRYPRGTPIDELDVDLAQIYDVDDNQVARAVDYWSCGGFEGGRSYVHCQWTHLKKNSSFTDYLNTVGRDGKYYKTGQEVYLDMQRDEYDRQLMESPLRVDRVRVLPTRLGTCFKVTSDKALEVASFTTSVDGAKVLSNGANLLPSEASQLSSRYLLPVEKYRAAAFAWNTAQNQLSTQLANLRELPTEDFRYDHPGVVDTYLQSAEALRPGDVINRSLLEVAQWAELSPEHVRKLQAMNVSDLRGLAETLNIAPVVDRVNRERENERNHSHTTPPARRGCNPLFAFWRGRDSSSETPLSPIPEPIPFGLTPEDIAEIRHQIGAALQTDFERSRQSRERPQTEMHQ